MCLCFLFTLLPAAGAAPDNRTKTIRAAWYEDSDHITGEKGERSGYGYEYEQAVASYTGWRYDYVKGDWSELLEGVQSGDIDIMGSVSRTPDREKTMLFSELPMGEEKCYLYADLTDGKISPSDLSTLNGKKIVVLEGSVQGEQFIEWEQIHGIRTQHIEIHSMEKAIDLAQRHEIDGVIYSETPKWPAAGMSAITQIGGSDVYFAINPNRPDLKEELDNAMRKMSNDMPFYADELYKRYLSATSTAVLDSTEKNWLAQHGDIRVGWLIDDIGYSNFEPGVPGKLTGIITDYIVYAKDCLGENTLSFLLKGFDSQEEQLQALKNGEIDMIFHAAQNPYMAERNDLILSNTVMKVSLAAVTTQKSLYEDKVCSVAVVSDDLVLQWYISYYHPTWQVVACDSQQTAEKIVRSGGADCFLVENGRLNQYMEDNRYRCVFLTQPQELSFAVRRDNPVLLAILNKTLKAMQSSMLTGALSLYDSSAQRVTLASFVKDNLLPVASGFLAFFLMILLVILSFLRKSRMAEATAREAAAQSLELNRQLQKSQQELQAALIQAESANAAKTTFLSNMSHDIRTPMNAIVGITRLMEHENGLTDRLRGYIHKVQSSSRHLLGLINDILDMSRIESREVKLKTEEVSLAEQVGQVDSIIRAQANERKQNFVICNKDIVHENLICDGVHLRQVFLNLLSNAVKYTPEGGDIEFELSELPCSIYGYAKFAFTVTDTGYGMTPEFVGHIFEPFTRAENSMTNKVQGTGLGMAITKNIVDLMGGEIKVESEVGKGSRFTVTLTLRLNERADRTNGAEHVLLISEDERLIRNTRAALSETDTAFEAAHFDEAEKRLRESTTDVIMLTGALPGKTLKETVSLCRELAKNAVLIFFVDYQQEEKTQAELTGSGVDGMIPRPFFLSHLASAIASTRARTVSSSPNRTILYGKRFLCAEDNELNAEILKELLHMYGAECTIYPDGKQLTEAFKTLKPGEYDAILMDIQMPVMNGLDATRAVRSGSNPLGRTIPIIAMTANAFSEDVQNCLDAGMDAHIAKPLDIALLEKTLRSLLRKR